MPCRAALSTHHPHRPRAVAKPHSIMGFYHRLWSFRCCLLMTCLAATACAASEPPPLRCDVACSQFPKSVLVGVQSVKKFHNPSAPVDAVRIYLVNIR